VRWDQLLVLLEEHVAAFREDPAIACHFVRDGPVIGAATLMLMGRPAAAGEVAAPVGDHSHGLHCSTSGTTSFTSGGHACGPREGRRVPFSRKDQRAAENSSVRTRPGMRGEW
jgi:hypothetical protein